MAESVRNEIVLHPPDSNARWDPPVGLQNTGGQSAKEVHSTHLQALSRYNWSLAIRYVPYIPDHGLSSIPSNEADTAAE